MPSVDAHAPGSFCWFELGTSDQAAAKQFYQSLFNWTSEDHPMGPSGSYTIFNLEGGAVAAAYKLNPQQQAQGVPPHWLLYVAVEDADAVAKRATELGGQVYMPPFDVMDRGRMTVMADPTGAVFSVWQPNQQPGVGTSGVDGTVCWADLSTPNAEAAKAFYSQLFGWDIRTGEDDPSGYLHIFNRQTAIGGIPPAQYRNAQTPPHWLLYFLVSDCAAAVEKAKGLGASVLMSSTEIPDVGFMAVLKDPQGAAFAFFQAPKS